MSSTIKIVEGNTSPYWEITCQRNDVIVPLTGVSVTVNITDGTTITRTGGVATVFDAANGIVHYTPTVSDTVGGGPFQVDVRLLNGDGSHEILYDQLKVKTRPPIIPEVS